MQIAGCVRGNCCKGLPVEEIKMFLLEFPSLHRLHCDFCSMVSEILEVGGERLTLKNSCAGGPVGNSNS